MPEPDPLFRAAIGRTPWCDCDESCPGGCGSVWLELESGNPTASYTDRMAVSVIEEALKR